MTAVDRPDNGQDEGARKSDAFAEWYSGSRAFMSYQIAFDAGWDAALNSRRAGAGEQQREQVARWLIERDGYVWREIPPRYLFEADWLLALLGGPQPDEEVRQHRMDPDCWCGPVQADNGAWDHQ